MTPQERRSLACCCGVLGGGGNDGGCIFEAKGPGAGVCVTEAIGWHGCVALGNGWGSLPGSGLMVRIQSINMAEICVSWLAFLDSSSWRAPSTGVKVPVGLARRLTTDLFKVSILFMSCSTLEFSFTMK